MIPTQAPNQAPIQIIGVDPDADRHGIAVYYDHALQALHTLTLPEIIDYLYAHPNTKFYFAIENVLAQSFVYNRNNQGNRAYMAKIANNIGRNQQAQLELTRILDHLGVPYLLIKPTAKNWADDKARFVLMTQWQGTSNKDTRSAAYFGYLLAMDISPVKLRSHA